MARSRSATSSIGTRRRARPAARWPGRATTPRWRRGSTARRRGRGTHWLDAHDADAARGAAIDGRGPGRASRSRRGGRARRAGARALADRSRAAATRRASAGGPTERGLGPASDLQERAAEAAFAVGRTSRATAYLEVGDRRARRAPRPGPAGPAPRAAGPHPARGRRPGRGDARGRDAPSSWSRASRRPARATVLAALAQLHDARRHLLGRRSGWPREAIKVARACDPVARDQEVHATTTLAVALAWGSDPSAAIELLREAERRPRASSTTPTRCSAIRANLTTVLDLVGRRAEAVDVAYRGIEDARRAGLEAVYGNFLAGNVTESLFLLGRWHEARELSARALALAAGRASSS